MILSRAFWVQDGLQCDEHIVDRSEHRTVSAKPIRIVVFDLVGVSPEELSRTSVVQLQAGCAGLRRAYTTRINRRVSHFKSGFRYQGGA